MPRFRPDLDQIKVYLPGKPIEELTRELGIADVIKLASNEAPVEPFPEVVEAIARAAAEGNRYPETTSYHLRIALGKRFGISPDAIWVGPGGGSMIVTVGLAVGGEDTSAVYADPSFVMYDIATAVGRGRHIRVPLDGAARHDPEAMVAAVDDDTTVLYLCNPNNPTGTIISPDAVGHVIEHTPDRVLVFVDEAYHEYVTAPRHESALPWAMERDNVVVFRTFSKVFGLAGLRVGYVMGHPDTVRRLQVPQPPFAVTSVSQAAALEALRHTDRLEARVKDNAMGREHLMAELADRGIECFESQTNFVAFRPDGDCAALANAMLHRGVIVRPLGPLMRVTVGTPEENERFLAALDACLGRDG